MRNLPDGTVTFLFTDIEGSTRIWQRDPDAMKIALSRHDALLRDAVESNEGVVVKTTGDGSTPSSRRSFRLFSPRYRPNESCAMKSGILCRRSGYGSAFTPAPPSFATAIISVRLSIERPV